MSKERLRSLLKEALSTEQVAALHAMQQSNPQLASNLTRAIQGGMPVDKAAQQIASYYYQIQQPVPQELQNLISVRPSTPPAAQPTPGVVKPMQVQQGAQRPSIQNLRTRRSGTQTPAQPAPRPAKKVDVSRLRPGSKPKMQAQPATPQLPPVSTIQPGQAVPREEGIPKPGMATDPTMRSIPSTRPTDPENAGQAVEDEAAVRAAATKARGSSHKEDFLKGHHMRYKDNPQYQQWLGQQPQEYQDKMNALTAQQERSEAGTVAPPRRKKQMPENKVIKTKAQLKEGVKKAVIKEQNRKLVKRILREQVEEQLRVKKLAESILQEGIWDRLKAAGSAVGDKLGMGGVKMPGVAADVMGQGDMASRREQQLKEISSAIEQAIKKANQQRQKFNSQALKNAEMMNQYHESAMRAFEIYKRFEGDLGPMAMQMNRQVNDVLEGLEEDLMSEISQIEAMLKNVSKKDDSLDSKLAMHKARAEEKREREAETEQSMRGGAKMPMKMKMAGAAHQDAAPGEEESTPEQRVGAVDRKQQAGMKVELGELNQAYKEQSKDLVARSMKTSDKNERKAIIRQLMDLAKNKKDREKELRQKYAFTR